MLATVTTPIDVVIRFGEDQKLGFKGVPFIETKLTERYGYQAVLGAYGAEGEYLLELVKIVTDYKIKRMRVEIAIPSGCTLSFLKELRKNLTQAIKDVQHWERARLLK